MGNYRGEKYYLDIFWVVKFTQRSWYFIFYFSQAVNGFNVVADQLKYEFNYKRKSYSQAGTIVRVKF